MQRCEVEVLTRREEPLRLPEPTRRPRADGLFLVVCGEAIRGVELGDAGRLDRDELRLAGGGGPASGPAASIFHFGCDVPRSAKSDAPTAMRGSH